MTAVIETEEQLEDVLSTPDVRVIEMLDSLSGDILVLGAAGKIGPGIVRMARRANGQKRIIAVDRFTDATISASLEKIGVEILAGDLSEPGFLKNLPRVENVLYLIGRKFGAAEDLPLTWMINTHIAGLVAGQFSDSRIVVFSTGNVYPFVDVNSAGAEETENPQPLGEYAQSCLGRERLFEYFSRKVGVAVFIFRLNYAVELRYGVLLDIALKVWREREIDLTMGYFNVIWQGDVNAMALRALPLCASPARIVNITGPERLSVRQLAERFGRLFAKKPHFVGKEAQNALLSNTQRMEKFLGRPSVSVETMISWIADWVKNERPSWDKPTHFQVRDGTF